MSMNQQCITAATPVILDNQALQQSINDDASLHCSAAHRWLQQLIQVICCGEV
jgi:hypothetical protein